MVKKNEESVAVGARPSLPYTERNIKNARDYADAVKAVFNIKGENGDYRSSYSWVPVIKPEFDQHGRNFALEAWVQYWSSIGMKERCIMAVKAVLKDRKEFGVPAEFPWLFDGHYTMRVQVPALPKKLLQRVGLVGSGGSEEKSIDLRSIGTGGFTRYKTPEGREAFRRAVLYGEPEPGYKTASLAYCYAIADAAEAKALREKRA